MRQTSKLATMFVVCAAVNRGVTADGAPSATDFSGQYRCLPLPRPCGDSGQSFTVTQSGSDFQVKNDRAVIGTGSVTSGISLSLGPPWNMLGVVPPGTRAIQWSNGTEWRKQ